jgi:hypothetical protein
MHMHGFQPRFANGIYRDCRFCAGKGCIACPSEAHKEYKRQFPDGPKPLATFNLEDDTDREKMADLVGAPAIAKHFGEGGGGIGSFIEALRAAGKLEE